MIVAIEGNIGSGKSTALDALEKRGYNVIKEPVDSWAFLERRYSDPKRWAFTFQVEAILSFHNLPSRELVFVERSAASAILFSQAAFEEGFLSSEELALLRSIEIMVEPKPALTIFIDTPPDLCHQRIKERGRSCETITPDYLKLIDKKHKANFSWMSIDGKQSPDHIADAIVSKLGYLRYA